MTVILRKSLIFTQYETDSNGKLVYSLIPVTPGILSAGVGNSGLNPLNGPLTLSASPHMQIAPNWIQNTSTFTTAVATGDLIVMSQQNIIGGNSYPST